MKRRVVTPAAICVILLVLPFVSAVADAQSDRDRTRVIDETLAIRHSFLSDSDVAFRYLESLQKIAYQDDPHAFRWTGDVQQIARLKTLLQELDTRDPTDTKAATRPGSYSSLFQQMVARLHEPVPTRYEDPNSILILHDVSAKIAKELKATIPAAAMPRIGTLPLGSLEARALIIPGSSESLIVVNSGLFSFCHELMKIALRTISYRAQGDQLAIDYSEETFDGGPRRDRDLRLRLSKALEDFALARRINGQDRPAELEEPALVPMVEAMEIFTVAHEYGHIVLRHNALGAEPIVFTGSERLERPAEEVRRDWGQEIAADLFAYRMLDQILESEWKDKRGAVPLHQYVRYAPILFFQLAAIGEEASYIHANAAPPRQPSASRRQAILDFMLSALSDDLERTAKKPTESRVAPPSTAALAELGDHPPTWARQIMLQAYFAARQPRSIARDEAAFLRLGTSLASHLRTMWNDMSPAWVQVVRKINEESGKAPVARKVLILECGSSYAPPMREGPSTRTCPARGIRAFKPRYSGIGYQVLDLESAACFVPDEQYQLLDKLVSDAKAKIDALGPLVGDREAKAALAEQMSAAIGDVLEVNGFALFLPTDALSDALGAHLFDCDTGSLIYLTVAQALGLPVTLVEITLPSGDSHNYIRWQLDPTTTMDWDVNGRAECRTPANTPAHQGRSMSETSILGYVRALRAMIRERSGDYPEALADLVEATNMYPDSALAHNNLAWLVATKEFPDRKAHRPDAKEHALRAVALLRNASHLDTLACSYAYAGEFDSALTTIEEALRLSPSNEAYAARRDRIRAKKDCTGFK